MPLLQNTSVRITGVNPDPTNTTTFRWKIRVLYTTRQRAPEQKEVFWEREVQGGTLPAEVLRSGGTMVGETAADGSHLSSAAGGDILFEVRATVNGQEIMASREGPIIRARDNPARDTIQTRLNSDRQGAPLPADEAQWFKAIACQENRLTQFVPTTATGTGYVWPGEPWMSADGLGGVGIFQITLTTELPDGPSSAEMWDWRANVVAAQFKFEEAKRGAANFPGRVRRHPGFDTLRNNTNTRREQNRMQPFREIRVPNFTRDQFLEDSVRGYNGYGGRTDPLFPTIRDAQGNVINALPLHEFTLETQNVGTANNPVYILVVTDLGGGIAEARWRRVDVADRGNSGDPNYVENVRRFLNSCPER
jgi:hypothetical protein